jgi:hypothetical protein
MTPSPLNAWKRFKDLLWALYRRHTWNYLVIHRHKLTRNHPSLVIPLLCGPAKKKLTCPPELNIVLVNNYQHLSLMELSLRYVGIENYTVLKVNGPWRQSYKLKAIFDYLANNSKKTEYLLYCDSNDAVLRDNPQKAIQYLNEENCDLLFSRTKFKGGYECLPQIKAWADQIARGKGSPGWYLNSGVYIGRTNFLRQILEIALNYITEQDLSREEYRQLRLSGKLCERLPEFPRGCGSDQAIFRFLHPQFYPRIKVDYSGRLALR